METNGSDLEVPNDDDEEMKTMRAPRDEKIKKAHGIFIQTTCLDVTNY